MIGVVGLSQDEAEGLVQVLAPRRVFVGEFHYIIARALDSVRPQISCQSVCGIHPVHRDRQCVRSHYRPGVSSCLVWASFSILCYFVRFADPAPSSI